MTSQPLLVCPRPARRAKENSPPFPTVGDVHHIIPSPVRDERNVVSIRQPNRNVLSSLTGLGRRGPMFPAINRRAIIGHPCGMGRCPKRSAAVLGCSNVRRAEGWWIIRRTQGCGCCCARDGRTPASSSRLCVKEFEGRYPGRCPGPGKATFTSPALSEMPASPHSVVSGPTSGVFG
jgi:hypothetical protein